MKKSNMFSIHTRKRLDREDIIGLILERGDAKDLDLTYTDLSDTALGSNLEPMPPLDGAIFGKYGDVRSGTFAENAFFQRILQRKV